MKLIIAGTRPPDYIVKNVKKYAEWCALLINRLLDFDKNSNTYTLRVDFSSSHHKLRRIRLSNVQQVVSGCAYGTDHVGEIIARIAGKDLYRFLAEWTIYGKPAGMIRNRDMSKYGDELYLAWDGKSNGSRNMKEEMVKRGKKVHEVLIEDWTLGVK